MPNNETSPNNSSYQTDQKLSSNKSSPKHTNESQKNPNIESSPKHTNEQESPKNPSIESSPKHAINPNNESSPKHRIEPKNENSQLQPNDDNFQEEDINTSAQVIEETGGIQLSGTLKIQTFYKFKFQMLSV